MIKETTNMKQNKLITFKLLTVLALAIPLGSGKN